MSATLPAVLVPVPRSAPGTSPPRRLRRTASGSAAPTLNLLRIGELATLGCLVLGTGAATAMVRLHAGLGTSHLGVIAAWALLAAVSAVGLAASAGRQATGFAVLLLALHLGALTEVVAQAGGLSGPFWVLFLPVLLVAAAASDPLAGLALGGLTSGCVYGAAWQSHTIYRGVGFLVVILPLFPVAGWTSSALCAGTRRAARDAAGQRRAIAADIETLIDAVDRFGRGELAQVPALSPASPPETARLVTALADTLVALRRLARRLSAAGTELSSRAPHVLVTAQEHAAAVRQQHAAVQETSATVSELANTAEGIAASAELVSTFARDTMEHVGAGDDAVTKASAAMTVIAQRVDDITQRALALSAHTGRIGTILAEIEQFAVLTNRLAFGAAIEAARAGEQGAGFRLVAAEVRRLAERSREATDLARRTLEAVAAEAAGTVAVGQAGELDVELGTQRAAEVMAALRRVATEAAGTVGAAAEILAASQQQREAAASVAQAMAELGRTSARYTQGSEHYLSAAGELRTLADQLREPLAQFKVG